MSTTVTVTTRVVTDACCNCGVTFGMDESYVAELRRSHRTFYCPNGHGQHYTAETDAERLKRENERLKSSLEYERNDHASKVRSLQIRAGKATAKAKRLETRIHAGVCPYCSRTFQQLARHMHSKHPDVVAPPQDTGVPA